MVARLDGLSTHWFDELTPENAAGERESIELTFSYDSRVLRSVWNELERSELDSSTKNCAAHAERTLTWARVRDMLDCLRPETIRELGYVLVRASFRGLSFEDGAQAKRMR